MDEAPIIMKITLPYKGVHKSMQSNTNSGNQIEKSKTSVSPSSYKNKMICNR